MQVAVIVIGVGYNLKLCLSDKIVSSLRCNWVGNKILNVSEQGLRNLHVRGVVRMR